MMLHQSACSASLRCSHLVLALLLTPKLDFSKLDYCVNENL